MVRRALLITSLFMATLGAAFAGDGKPAALVTEVYGTASAAGHFQQPLAIFVDDALRQRYLSKRLRAALADMDKNTQEGDIPNLDFDAVSDSQDPDVRDLKIKTESESAGEAAVTADFRSHDDKERTVLRYTLVREDGSWKIDEVAASGKSQWRISDVIAGRP